MADLHDIQRAALANLDEAICRVRQSFTPEMLAAIPELHRSALEHALVYGRTALAQPDNSPTRVAHDLLKLMQGEFAHLHITWNDFSGYYMKAPDWEAEQLEGGASGSGHRLGEWVSDADKERALRENSVWTIQFYPRTPVGFYAFHAATLEGLMNYLNANAKDLT